MVRCCGQKYGYYVHCNNCNFENDENSCIIQRRNTKYGMLDIYPKNLKNSIIDLWIK